MSPKPFANKWQTWVALATLLLFGVVQAGDSVDEESIKIAYLSKFPLFVEWPVETTTSSEQPFRLCVASGDEMNSINAKLKEQQIKRHEVAVLDARRMDTLTDCHLVYVGSSEAWRIRSILAEVKDHPVLTVSDAENFAKEGGIIGLVKQENRLKFEINLTAAKRVGLRIPAQLAQLAIKTY